VFRDGEARAGYQTVKVPRKVAFLLASSVEKPKSEAKGRTFVLDAPARADLEAKVTAILSAGIEKAKRRKWSFCFSISNLLSLSNRDTTRSSLPRLDADSTRLLPKPWLPFFAICSLASSPTRTSTSLLPFSRMRTA